MGESGQPSWVAKRWDRAPSSLQRAFLPIIHTVRPHFGRPLHHDDEHPERLAVLGALGSLDQIVVEIGCGPRKTAPSFIGIDLTPGGTNGITGNASGRASQADVAADGSSLPVASASVDAVVARHNLEHYVDTFAVLREWARVVRPRGRLIVIVPDEDRFDGRTVELDPTHYHSFNESFLTSMLEASGWTGVSVGPCIDGWSLLATATRT